MIHFAFAIYSVVFTTLFGVATVALILAGYFFWTPLLAAGGLAALASLPATYAVLRAMDWR
ncbi:hypothetical protein [Sulfitobacter sp. S190]|uniref:hypothetical protein n=1 Tax=Sulfitobacter sp. S190 TaxID=2867022 RepID=UPI0021A27A70|nr:hypothetical protein [Sulfitobacter sp. S190]UWR21968.1 hypothetical protein K3756_14965 [Sulfitobacter sp. S190]